MFNLKIKNENNTKKNEELYINEVDEIFRINDTRNIKDFNSITFSCYKKNDSKKKLMESLINKNIEDSNYWSIQFICSNHYIELWDIIIEILSKYIYTANPKLFIFVDNKFKIFKDILIHKYHGDELKLRNNKIIRNLFANVITSISLSNKKNKLSNIKISKNELDLILNKNKISENYNSKNKKIFNEIFQEGDPKELFIPISELICNLLKPNSSSLDTYYWIEWILQYERECKQKKHKIICSTRNNYDIHEKYRNDLIWLIWDILLYQTKSKKNLLLNKIVQSMLNLFCISYSSTKKNKRKIILYNVILLLTEKINFKNIPILNIEDVKYTEIITTKINLLYKEVKKTEIINYNQEDNTETEPDTKVKTSNKKNNEIESNFKMDKLKELDIF
jgi:hypothetical protein